MSTAVATRPAQVSTRFQQATLQKATVQRATVQQRTVRQPTRPARVARRGRSAAHGGVRLTRRGRVMVVLTVLALFVVGFSIGGHVSSQAADSAGVTAPRTVTVQPGESLWALATRIAPHVDPRLVVAQIQQLNHLHSPQLMAGQQLRVPVAR